MYYNGISFLNESIFQDVPLDEYFDLSKIFRSLSTISQLFGKKFLGKVIDLGEKEKYLNVIADSKIQLDTKTQVALSQIFPQRR
ncbi:MAG: hypothetical protein SFU98_09515 [Leptospiraceae bacterium]|nr:hypothetical protein [Leptospiraceae bacterium]